MRLTLLRTGVVLEKDGGALGKILPLYYSFTGGCVGSGRNWLSWIHRDDLVGLISEALRNPKYAGVVNGTAPSPVRFAQFCEEVARATDRPNALPVPGFVVRILLGEGATVVLDGQKVLPKCVRSAAPAPAGRGRIRALARILPLSLSLSLSRAQRLVFSSTGG